MYATYFGFREKPFNDAPDPRFLYTNSSYKEAYASLLYGIRERKGLIVLTGEVGTGKTTLLRRLMNDLGENTLFSFLNNTNLTFDELLDFTCDDLRMQVKGLGRHQKILTLNKFLINQLKAGGTAALLIDEAQNLREEVLEDLRLLSNLETADEKLLQIVLAGEPELEISLDQPKLRQLKQRVAIRCRLGCLKDREVGPFIDYRLTTAGYEGDNLFTPEAIRRIANYSKGIPRPINIICDNALLIAYRISQKTVAARIIEEVAHDLRLKDGTHGFPVPTKTATDGVPPQFLDHLTHELTEAMGPMASVIVRDQILALGESRETFPKIKLGKLIESVSREILDEMIKHRFRDLMFKETVTLGTP